MINLLKLKDVHLFILQNIKENNRKIGNNIAMMPVVFMASGGCSSISAIMNKSYMTRIDVTDIAGEEKAGYAP